MEGRAPPGGLTGGRRPPMDPVRRAPRRSGETGEGGGGWVGGLGGWVAGPARPRGGGGGAVTITSRKLEGGPRLTFTTRDHTLIDALHRWGEAQTSDHGGHHH